MTFLNLDQSWTNCEWGGNTRVNAEVDVSSNKLHAMTNTAIGGSGHAQARLFTDYSPFSSGKYEIAVDYYRNGDIINGEAKVYVIVKDDFGGVDKYPLETIKSGVNRNITRSAEGITLDSDTDYQIGVEVYTTASTIMNVSYADFYNSIVYFGSNRHRVTVTDCRIRKE